MTPDPLTDEAMRGLLDSLAGQLRVTPVDPFLPGHGAGSVFFQHVSFAGPMNGDIAMSDDGLSVPPAYCPARNLTPFHPSDCLSPDCSCGFPEDLRPDGIHWLPPGFELPQWTDEQMRRMKLPSDRPPIVTMAMAVGPSWSARFWRWLGFGTAYVERPEDREGFAPGYGCSDVIVTVDWRDRLRVLISGKVMLQMLHQTDVMPGRWESVSAFKVLPPNYPIRRS